MSLRPSPDVIARAVEPGGVLVHLGQNVIYELNATGMAVWSLLSEGRSRAEILERITDEFDVTPAQAHAEVDALIVELREQGLLES